MLHRRCQDIVTDDGFSAIRLDSLKYNSRFLLFGILEEIGVHLATKKAVSDNIKRVAQTINCQLLSPVVAGVSSQSD